MYVTGPRIIQKEHATESHNHRMVEVGMDVWRSSSPTHLLKQGHLKHIGQDHSTTSLGNLFQCSVTFTVKTFFLICHTQKPKASWMGLFTQLYPTFSSLEHHSEIDTETT